MSDIKFRVNGYNLHVLSVVHVICDFSFRLVVQISWNLWKSPKKVSTQNIDLFFLFGIHHDSSRMAVTRISFDSTTMNTCAKLIIEQTYVYREKKSFYRNLDILAEFICLWFSHWHTANCMLTLFPIECTYPMHLRCSMRINRDRSQNTQ